MTYYPSWLWFWRNKSKLVDPLKFKLSKQNQSFNIIASSAFPSATFSTWTTTDQFYQNLSFDQVYEGTSSNALQQNDRNLKNGFKNKVGFEY